MLSTFYADRLSIRDREAYGRFLSGIRNRRREISLGRVNDVLDVITAVNYDHPELFYVNWVANFPVIRLGGLSSVRVQYIYDEEQTARINEKIAALAEGANGRTDREKSAFVHDTLVKRLRYDREGLENPIRSPAMYSAAGPALYGKGVCEGISKLGMMMLRALGVECRLVCGGNHAWISLIEDGDVVYTDITYDMGRSVGRFVSRDYFDLPREKMLHDHRAERY